MDVIDRIIGFNRVHARRMDRLRLDYLEAGLNPAEARVIFELADGRNWLLRALAAHLSLNEGYLSRVVSRLEREGLVKKTRHPKDKRAQVLALTRDGLIRAAELTALSRRQIATWLHGLPEADAERMGAQFDALEAALSLEDAGAEPPDLRPLAIGDAGWLIERHATLYAASDGFDASFEALVAEILAGFLRSHDPAREAGWIAWQGGRRIGSIFCVAGPAPDTAKLRLFLLVPEARGQGLGRRLLDHCMEFARARGYRRLLLATHESHRAACALYEKTGFSLDRATPVRSFGVDLVEQHWSIDLVP